MFFHPFHPLIVHSWKRKAFNQWLPDDVCNLQPTTYNHVIFQMSHMNGIAPHDGPPKHYCDYNQLWIETIWRLCTRLDYLLPPQSKFLFPSHMHICFFESGGSFCCILWSTVVFFLKRCKFSIIHICLFESARSLHFILWSTFFFERWCM